MHVDVEQELALAQCQASCSFFSRSMLLSGVERFGPCIHGDQGNSSRMQTPAARELLSKRGPVQSEVQSVVHARCSSAWDALSSVLLKR